MSLNVSQDSSLFLSPSVLLSPSLPPSPLLFPSLPPLLPLPLSFSLPPSPLLFSSLPSSHFPSLSLPPSLPHVFSYPSRSLPSKPHIVHASSPIIYICNCLRSSSVDWMMMSLTLLSWTHVLLVSTTGWREGCGLLLPWQPS